MDCIHPISAWICGSVRCKTDGQISPNLVFSYNAAFEYFARKFGASAYSIMATKEIQVRCGKCANCLRAKRRDASTRIIHERSCYEDSCFITLTYNDDFLPIANGARVDSDCWSVGRLKDEVFGLPTLYPRDITLFLKRLRRHLTYSANDGRDQVRKIRYFVVGEYGSRTKRPHYHLIIFNWFPGDADPRDGHNFTSKQIEKLWSEPRTRKSYGFHLVSRVSTGTCKYCAQYVTKKLCKAPDRYVDYRVPEFTRQSTKNGGMGIPWLMKWHGSVAERGHVTYRLDQIVVKTAISKSYIRCLRKYFPDEWLTWRDRAIAAPRHYFTDSELMAKENYNLARCKSEIEREVF